MNNEQRHGSRQVRQRGYGGPLSKAFIRRMGTDGWLGVAGPRSSADKGVRSWTSYIFYETIWAKRAPFPVLTLHSVAPTIMKFGSEEQKKEFLPRILRGDLEVAIGLHGAGCGDRPGGAENNRGARRRSLHRPTGTRSSPALPTWQTTSGSPADRSGREEEAQGISLLFGRRRYPPASQSIPSTTMGGHRVNMRVYLKNAEGPRHVPHRRGEQGLAVDRGPNSNMSGFRWFPPLRWLGAIGGNHPLGKETEIDGCPSSTNPASGTSWQNCWPTWTS